MASYTFIPLVSHDIQYIGYASHTLAPALVCTIYKILMASRQWWTSFYSLKFYKSNNYKIFLLQPHTSVIYIYVFEIQYCNERMDLSTVLVVKSCIEYGYVTPSTTLYLLPYMWVLYLETNTVIEKIQQIFHELNSMQSHIPFSTSKKDQTSKNHQTLTRLR